MRVELHAQRFELRASQFLFQFLRGPITLAITAYVFDHVSGAHHGPIQDELEIEMIEHHGANNFHIRR